MKFAIWYMAGLIFHSIALGVSTTYAPLMYMFSVELMVSTALFCWLLYSHTYIQPVEFRTTTRKDHAAMAFVISPIFGSITYFLFGKWIDSFLEG